MGDRRMRRVIIASLALAALAVTAGCLGVAPDDGDEALEETDAPDGPEKVPELPEEIVGLEAKTSLEGVEAGAGLHAEGDHVYVAGQNTGFYVVNVSTPTQPALEGHLPDVYARGVDLLHYDDRTVAVTASSGDGMRFIDVTNASRPEVLSTALDGEAAVHNVRAVPGEHIVYNSRSLDAPGVDVVDASDPENPTVETFLAGPACHDVTIGPEGERAYCPAVTETEIWDITDPTSPEVVTRIHNPSINIHHWARVTADGDTLLIGDEFAGSTDAAAGCWAAADTPLGSTASDPIGAIWFYDVSEETQPLPQGWVAPPFPLDNPPPGPCTAHFGEILEGRDKVVVGWRAAGTVLVDFQDPTQPRILDQALAEGDNWEVQVHNGYVFAGDTERGLDVLGFEAG